MASFVRPAKALAENFRKSFTGGHMFRNFLSLKHAGNRSQLACSIISSSNNSTRSFKVIGGVATAAASWGFLGISLKKEKQTEEEQIRELVSEGIVKKGKGDIEGASRAFHDALMLSTEFLTEEKITENDNKNHRVFIYDQIANMSMEMGQFKDAEKLFKETMKLAMILGMEPTDNAMIEMSLKLSMIFLYTGRTEIAHQGLLHCIAEQEKKIEAMKQTETAKESEPEKPRSPEEKKKAKDLVMDTKLLLGKAYKNYANSFLQSREFKKAKPLIVKSLDISLAELGPQHEMTFVIMNDLATCKIMLKEYEEAETLLLEGLKHSKKANSVMEAALSSNLGALYIRTGRYDEAETTCAKGLAIATKFKDEYFLVPCKKCMAKLQELRDMKKTEGEK